MSTRTLHELIVTRLAASDMDEAAFFAAMGVRDPRKGAAMLDRISREDMTHLAHLRRGLARTLGVPLAEVDAAAEVSAQLAAARWEAAWRDAFRPHAVLTTLRHGLAHGQIVIGLMAKAPSKLRIDLPDRLPVLAWPKHVAATVPEKLVGFGPVTGFVVNYAPDRAVWFDRTGEPHVTLTRAYIRATDGALTGLAPSILR